MRRVLFNHFGNIDLRNLSQCNKFVHENIEYCRSAVYVISLAAFNEQPIFAQVVFVLKLSEKWWLLIDKLDTVAYDEQLFSWEIKSVDRYSILDPSELRYYHKGLDIYHVNNSSFVSFINRLTIH
jgi:hypothetical protein